MINNEQHKQIRNALMVAAVDCGHTIDSDRIILQCDPAKQGNALAQLSGRLLDAYLAAAGASAAPVEPLPVAEPQVAADELAAFEVWAKAEGLIQESHGIRSTSSMCDVALKAWKAGRAASQAVASTPPGLAFMNAGAGPDYSTLDCPACGGNGHADDVLAGSAP